MKQIGVYEAKTQLPRLLDEVERGETITITRHGRPVARLVPVGGRRRSVRETIEAIEEFRKGHALGDLTIRELIEEGRRH
jgi:prevent-host-death family protein